MSINHTIGNSRNTAENATTAEPLTFMRINRLESSSPFLSGLAEEPEVGSITVNGAEISTEAILAEAQHHPADNVNEAMHAASRALVVRELLTQEAARKLIDSNSESDGSGRVEMEIDALISALLEREVEIPEANDADCERFYRLHPDKFSSDTLYEVRHILLAVSEGDQPKRSARSIEAKGIIAHLAQHPHEFTSIARSRSDCPSREHGGNLGQIGKGSTVPEFEDALAKLPVGSIATSAIESRYGFHVVRVERVIQGELLPFDAIKERIAAWLEASSWSRAMSQYISILAGQADIQGIDLLGSDSPLVQ